MSNFDASFLPQGLLGGGILVGAVAPLLAQGLLGVALSQIFLVQLYAFFCIQPQSAETKMSPRLASMPWKDPSQPAC